MLSLLFAFLLALAPPVVRVTLSVPRDTVTIGDTLRVVATVTAANGKAAADPVGWGLSAPAVAKFKAITSAKTTYVVALAAGTVAVDATAGGVTGSRVLVVRAAPPPPPPPSNAPPTARFTASCVLLACTVDGRGSTDDGGIARYTWTFADSGTVTIDGPTAAYTWTAPGTYPVTLRVADSTGLASTLTQTVTATPPPPPPPADTTRPDTTRTPTLPRLLDTRVPALTGRTLAVSATGSLQAALDTAKAGDVVTLANGAIYRGNFVLPGTTGCAAMGTGWVTIRPAITTALPAEGTRLIPTTILANPLPKIVSPNTLAPLATAPGACGWRVIGVEITQAAGVTTNFAGLVVIGTGNETALAQYPGRIVLDRVWLHGAPTLELKRAVSLNGIALAVIDSYISEIHGAGSMNETQGLLGWNGPGPFKIVNNYVEAGGVSIMFGGASDPNIPGVIPSDIEIRRNHVVKPLAWKTLPYTNKNALELKDAQRVLIEGNVFEHNWTQSQAGFILQMTAVSQTGTANWITVRDVTIRANVFRDSPQGINLLSRYGPIPLLEPTRRVAITDNVFEAIGPGNLLAIAGDADRVTIARNTAATVGNTFLMLLAGQGPATGLVVRDNLFAWGLYGLFGDAVGIGLPALTIYAPTAVVTNNAIVGGTASALPAGNLFPASASLAPAGIGADTALVRATTAGVVVP